MILDPGLHQTHLKDQYLHAEDITLVEALNGCGICELAVF